MENIKTFFEDYVVRLSLPDIRITDILEMIMIAYLIYHFVNWVKKTRAWMLVKGLIVVFFFWLIAILLELNVILYLFYKSINVGIIAVIIVFQPEFRKALEQLGQKNIVRSIITFDDSKDKNERFSDNSVGEIIRAVFDLAKTKTGALIVIEQETPLNEYVNTGILIDSLISSQLLINIFEHNTPLHDGAVILKNDRVVAATCYLPLSDNNRLSKELGTRHRAGIGVSEVTDSFTIIVSEESGKVSIAYNGQLVRNIDGDYLRTKLVNIQKKKVEPVVKKIKFWKGKARDERKTN